MLIYKEIGRRGSFNPKKKDISSCQIEIPQTSIKNTRKKSLRTSTKQSDDEEMGKSVGAKTLYIKNKARSSYASPSKLDVYNPQVQNKKYQAMKAKFLTEAKES